MLQSDIFWLATGAVVGALLGLVAAARAAGSWHRSIAIALASAHICAVLGVTLFPLPLEQFGAFQAPYSAVQLVPFDTIDLLSGGSQSVRQLGGNLLLLAPMGVLVPIAWRAARPAWRTVGWGVVISVAIEVLQFLFGMMVGDFYRVVDVDDVILNVAGVVAGRLVFAVGFPIWRWLMRARRTPH